MGVFTSTIEKLRGMRILQGDATLYITPKILHLKLWGQWYRQYHNIGLALPGYRPEDIEMFSPEANMLKWHTDMFRYAEEAGTNRFTDDLFARDGYADTYRLLDSAVGAEMFHSMAGADIDGAVDCIDRYIRSKTEQEFLELRDGRREVVMILWGALMKRRLFDKSAKLLRLLAEADDDPGRLAEDVFVSLFVPLPDAQTEVPPAARLHLIRKAHFFVNEKRRRLAVRACAEALTRPALIHSYDGDLCRDGKPWTPKSETEISEYYKEVLGILHTHLDYVRGEEEEANVIGTILEKGVNMLADPAVSDTVVDIVEDAYKEHHVDAETIMRAISTHVSINPFRPISESFLKEAGRLQDLLIGSDYRLLLKRTVSWSRVRDSDDPLNSLEQLARRSLDIDKLRPELAWLVTDEAVRGYDFGHTLGGLDDSGLLPEILNAQKQSKSPNVDFLAGYLRAVFKRDAGEWEGVMDNLLQDRDLRACVPEAASLSGITDSVAVRLHDVIREGHLEPSALKPFIHSNLVNELSEPVFQKWVGLLQGGDVASRQTCINLYWLYYVANKRRIPDSARNLLLSGDVEVVASDQTHMSFWCEILEGYVRQNPGDTEVLSGALAFASANLAGRGCEDTFYDLLCIVADKSPDEAWGYVAALLDAVLAADSDRAKHYFVANLLQGRGLIDKISLSVIYGWIDGAVERRAPLAAYVFPDSMDIAAEMISRYGGIGTVREMLTSRQARPRMRSYDVAKKIEELKSFRNETTEPSVLEWIDECIGAMGGD